MHEIDGLLPALEKTPLIRKFFSLEKFNPTTKSWEVIEELDYTNENYERCVSFLYASNEYRVILKTNELIIPKLKQAFSIPDSVLNKGGKLIIQMRVSKHYDWHNYCTYDDSDKYLGQIFDWVHRKRKFSIFRVIKETKTETEVFSNVSSIG